MKKSGASCPGPQLVPMERPHKPYDVFFFFFLYMPPPGFSLRWAICMDGSLLDDVFFFFFFFLYMPPPGFSFRAICMDFVVVVDLNSGVSVTAVEPAAWADSDKVTTPAAPRSALRMNDFTIEPHWLKVLRQITYSPEDELKMNEE
jgi:hypothetical protein